MTYTIMNADELADVSSLDVAMNLMNLGRWEAALDWAVCARMEARRNLDRNTMDQATTLIDSIERRLSR